MTFEPIQPFHEWPDLIGDLDPDAAQEVIRTFAAALLDSAANYDSTAELIRRARARMDERPDDTDLHALLISTVLIHEVHRADVIGRATLFASALDDTDIHTVDGAIIRAHLVMDTTTNPTEESP